MTPPPTRIEARRELLRHAAGVAATALLLRACAQIEAPWHALLAVALVPWLCCLDSLSRDRGALVSGLAMDLAFAALVFAWFARAIAGYAGWPLATGWLALLVSAPLLEPQLLAFAWVRVRARRILGDAWLGVAWLSIAAWVACDALWPKLFADGLGTGLHASRSLRQAADLAGVPGLTFAVLWVNELVWQAWRRMRAAGVPRERLRRAVPPLAAALALPALLHAYGALRLAQVARAPADPPVRVAVVQADIHHYDRMAALAGTWEATRRILDTHLAMSREALAGGGVDWLLWPETVYPVTYGAPRTPDAAALDLEIGRLVATRRVPLLFGAYDADGDREYNAAFFLMHESATAAALPFGSALTYDVYRKSRLFPFTERLPGFLDVAAVRAWLPWAGAWRAGEGARRIDLELPGGRALPVAPLICYDALDPTLAAASARAGARVIATLSNDSWFAEGAGPRLHLVQAAFRSIETRLPQVRSTNTGISALIDATGEIEGATGIHERTVLTGTLRPRAADLRTAGDGGRWLAFALLASCPVAVWLARRGRPGRHPQAPLASTRATSSSSRPSTSRST